jgi:hypothetical protein
MRCTWMPTASICLRILALSSAEVPSLPNTANSRFVQFCRDMLLSHIAISWRCL